MQPSTRKLIDALREDRLRFRQLYDQLQLRVRRHGGRYRPYVDDAMLDYACSDAVMAVMVRYAGHFEAPEDTSPAFDDALLGYLFNAACNCLMSALRRDARARRVFFDELAVPVDGPSHAGTSPMPWLDAVSADPGPEESALSHDRGKLLRDCMSRLTELARATLQLALCGMNDAQIQQQLGVASASTVRRRVHDAKCRMVECVQGKASGEAQP
jgi:DNA-directed RNA polymerase specialized sigma24 family protein